MAGLTARFSLIDEMSDKMSSMANAGQDMMERWEQAGQIAGSAIDGVTSSAAQAVSTIDGVAHSISDLQSVANGAESSASGLSTAISEFDSAIDGAVAGTDHWTASAQTYDKAALDMVYTTEELVDMGLKSADALREQEEMFALCEQSERMLNDAMQASVSVQEELSSVVEKSDEVMRSLSDNEKVSAEAKERLEQASQVASQAMQELTAAEEEAKAALENYDAVISSGTTDLNELESAAERAGHAAEALSQANEKASNATEDLLKATETASEEAENAGKSGVNAIETLSNALTSAGITKAVAEIAGAFMDASGKAAEFEVSLSKLSTIADTSSVSLNTISSDLLALSNDTGVATTSLTESAYQAISASVDTASAVDFVAQANELAVGGFTRAETAVDVLSTAINAYGLEVSQAGQLSDYLVTTQNLGKTSVDELAQSVGKVIPLASAYNVEMDNLSSAYAVLTANGIATAEAGTYLKSMFTELADSGSEVAGVLQDETGMSFSELSESGYSLGDVLAVIGESVGNDATAFSNLWSSSEAGVGALSLLNAGTEKYNSVLNEMQNSTGAASQAYDAMTNTTVHAQEEMVNSSNNLKIAIGQNLNPLIETLYEKAAQVMNAFTEFANEHPVVVKAVSAIAIGLGVAAGAIAAVTFATTIAIPAIVSFGVAFNAALGPIGWIALGITAVTTAAAAFCAMFDSAEEEVEDYSGTLSECADEISRAEAAYEKACERYGENSDAAQSLADQLDLLNAQYEKGGGAIEEFNQKIAASTEALHNMSKSHSDAMKAIDDSEISGLRAVSMLEALSQKTELTSGDLDIMSKYADYLNDTFNCDIVVNYDTGELTGFDPAAVTQSIIDAANDKRVQQSIDDITNLDFTKKYEEAFQRYDELMLKKSNLQKEYDELSKNAGPLGYEGRFGQVKRDLQETSNELQEAKKNFEEYDSALYTYGAAAEESGYSLDIFRDSLLETAKSGDELISMAEKTEDAANQTISYEEACSTAFEEVKDRVDDLCVAYDEAYQSALESFQNQFGLFEEASMESETYMNATIANAQAALDSQLAYWENYNANLDILTAYGEGLTGEAKANYDALLEYARSGDEEAAGLADNIAQAIENGDEQAIADLSETLAAVREQQSQAAQTTAEWQTDFNATMKGIISDMETHISELGFEEEASQMAASTMRNYANSLRSGSGEAITAIDEVTSAIETAVKGHEIDALVKYKLSTDAVDAYTMPDKTAKAEYELDSEEVDSYIPDDKEADAIYKVDDTAVDRYQPPDKTATVTYTVQTSGSVPAHAKGTTNAEDAFIAGEEGPELIIGKAGSTVFPTSETNKIVSAVSALGGIYKSPEGDRITYGDNHILENSYNYDTDYDNSRAIETVTNYGDTIKNVEENYMPPTDVSQTLQDSVISVFIPRLEMIQSILEKSFNDNLSGIEAYNNTPDVSVEYTVDKDLTEHISGEQDDRIFSSENDNRTVGVNEDEKSVIEPQKETSNSGTSENVKRIVIEIAGNGQIDITDGVDKQQVLELLQDNLKPVLMNIIQSEIYEEGDLSYDF